MKVGKICDHDVVTVCADATLHEAARLLCENEVDAIVTIASPVPHPTAIGIITHRDILTAMLERGEDLLHLRVLDVLSRHPVVINEDEESETALLRMRSRHTRYAPVVGQGGTLLGAVSQFALLLHQGNGRISNAEPLANCGLYVLRAPTTVSTPQTKPTV
jgi:CBS domain-containing protein